MLLPEDFKLIIQSAPLFSIDLVLLNYKKQILVGKRSNAPAKGYWFVPGGRVFKNESLKSAFERISSTELGAKLDYSSSELLGIYDHFYDDSVFCEDTSTHYISSPHLIMLPISDELSFPKEQHECYRWLTVDDLLDDMSVHEYSKVFIDVLNQKLS